MESRQLQGIVIGAAVGILIGIALFDYLALGLGAVGAGSGAGAGALLGGALSLLRRG